jgi:tRNA-dihydrouridine synthase B
MIKSPFNLGRLVLHSNVFCAPLAGCSDLPFRRMTRKYRPGLIYCEMVKMDALIRYDVQTFQLLDYEADMHPIGGQICGSKPEIAGKSARIIEDLGFDVVDLNCGCPVDKVTKDGSGSGMLKTPERIGEILANMVAAVKIPVTVKIRAGWDEDSINAVEITQIAEKAGAAAICIHGRTREQGYQGPANWDYIRACKAVAKEILVIGNGDIVDAMSAERIFLHTGCDAILLSRGTFGHPWLIEDIYRHFASESAKQRTGCDYREALLEHFEHVLSYRTERKALLDMRRVGCWYLKKAVGVKAMREAINHCKSVAEMKVLLQNYPWHEQEFKAAESLA